MDAKAGRTVRFNLPFMRWRRAGLVLSSILTGIALLATAIWGLNYSIDFTGGSLWTLRFAQPVAERDVAAVFADQGVEGPIVQSVGQTSADGRSHEFVVRTRPVGEERRQAITAALGERLGQFEVVSFDDVSPTIGREIKRNAAIALAVSTAAMILYITLRFEFRFALTAIAALIHDLLIMVGVFAIFRFEVDTTFIAAMLTVFGYSINDTIIVYDRIRENLPRYRRDQLLELVDDSVNQTLTRTINTGFAAALAIAAVAVFGGESIRHFAIALLAGILTGTYSSIFIASTLWVEWRLRAARRREATA